MKIIKRIIIGIFVLIVILLAVIMFRAIRLQSTKIESKPIAKFTVDLNSKQSIEHLSKAITFKTISFKKGKIENPQAFKDFHEFLLKTYPLVFSQLDIKQIGEFGLLMIWKGSDPKLKPILLMAHQDVVPVNQVSINKWQYPPFSGKAAEGYIWGRGSIDDKLNMISSLEAVELLLKQHYQPLRGIYLFFGDNEEVGGATAQKAAKWLENKGVQFEFILDEGSFIVNDLFTDVATPVALLSIGEKGYLDVELKTHQVGGHSSMPPAETTIGILSRAINRLENNKFSPHLIPPVRMLLENIAPFRPLSQKLFLANLWLFEPLVLDALESNTALNPFIRTTTAPTIFQAGIKPNILPPTAKAVVNFRILEGDSVDTVMQHIRDTINDDRVKLKILVQSNPVSNSAIDSPGYEALVQVIKQIYSEPMMFTPVITIGATDSRHFKNLARNIFRFSFVKVSKDIVKRIHGVNERVSIDNYLNNVMAYYQFIKLTSSK